MKAGQVPRSVVKSGQWSCSRSNLRQRHTAMEGGHNQQRLVADAIIVCDKAEAAKMRRRAQHGAAYDSMRSISYDKLDHLTFRSLLVHSVVTIY